MARILTHDGAPVLALTFDETFDLRNSLFWTIRKRTEQAEYWEERAAESGDEVQFNGRTLSRKKEAARERELAERYERLRAVITEYMERGGVTHV